MIGFYGHILPYKRDGQGSGFGAGPNDLGNGKTWTPSPRDAFGRELVSQVDEDWIMIDELPPQDFLVEALWHRWVGPVSEFPDELVNENRMRGEQVKPRASQHKPLTYRESYRFVLLSIERRLVTLPHIF
jgi:hypothetical protein